MTSLPRASTRMAEPSASITSIDGVFDSSQGRAMNSYGFEVSAPTGQRSTTLPDSSDIMPCSRYVVISMSSPRPMAPSSSTPATSVMKRMQRVQWMQRVM